MFGLVGLPHLQVETTIHPSFDSPGTGYFNLLSIHHPMARSEDLGEAEVTCTCTSIYIHVHTIMYLYMYIHMYMYK